MTITRLLLCLGLVGCVPPGAGPGVTAPDSTPNLMCDMHASQLGDTCSCDAGYSGDGMSCTQDEPPAPSCDIHASVFAGSCQCDPGYSGSGFTCTADS